MARIQEAMSASITHSPTTIYNWNANNFEYNAMVNGGFFDTMRRGDFQERYLALVDGLDEESIATVNQMLARISACEGKSGVPLDIYSRAEKENILFLEREFYPYVLKVSEDCWAYRQYRLPINHFEPCVFLDKHGLDQVQTPAEKIAERDIVDAGGFIGDSVLIFSPRTNKKVYSFEPISENYTNMVKTMRLNGIENAVCERLALGREPGIMEFNVAGSCSNKFVSDAFAQESVPVVTLDDYVQEHNLDVGLIKVDLEGAEQDFIAGAKRTITTQKPVLLLSMYHNANDFFDLKKIIESWDVGYKFKVHKSLDYCIYLESMLIAEVPT